MLNPEEQRTHRSRPGDGACDGVAHVVHYQEECDKKAKPARNNFQLYNKADPADDNHETARDEVH